MNGKRIVWLAMAGAALMASALRAADPENCLSCHRFRGLSRIEDGRVRLFYVNPRYHDYGLGAHARLRCTDCHERSEVEVIPHRPVTPVNCTRQCHLAGPGEMEVRFAHRGIEEALEQSAHSPKVLERCNELLGEPLRPGQARCLLCHDEPVFRRDPLAMLGGEANVARCTVCHSTRPQRDLRFAYWHVHARTTHAYRKQDTLRLCALCHANEAIRKEFELPDTTASYLFSFHGKAMALGAEDTAGCLDCHVAELADVHLMRAADDPLSPTHPERIADTCRSAACHPTAGHAVSSAAVHLDLATTRGIEFMIAVLFVVLIVTTFGPSVVLNTLELLQQAVGRRDPRHAERLALLERLEADPATRQRLVRFTPHQRVQHWVLVICFVLLVVTGFPIKFADQAWAAWVVDRLGGLSVTRRIHRWAGAVLIAGFAYHVLYILVVAWGRRRKTGRSWGQVLLDLPMVMRRQEWKALVPYLGYLLLMRPERPPAGRFNLKEKFEYFGVFWGCTILGLTGVLLWAHAWTTHYLPGRALTVATVIHTLEAYLAVIHIGLIHLVGVIFAPGVFPGSPAMFTGRTPTEELIEGHAGFLEEVQAGAGSGPGGAEVPRG